MFSNMSILLYLFILIEHACSVEKSYITPETYPVTSDWIFESDTLPPANLSQKLFVNGDGESVIVVNVNDQREDFDVTLLANPFDKKDGKYPGPELNTSDYNLRQYYTTGVIYKEDTWPVFYYDKVFTGWYYLVITNKHGSRWKFGPKFYRTNHPFVDMRVQLKGNVTFTPESTETTMSSQVHLTVPLDCIVVRIRIYELKKKVNDAMTRIEHGRVPSTQTCWIKNIGKDNIYADCDYISHIDKPTVSSVRNSIDDPWDVHIVWNNLTRGGGNYYLDYSDHDSRNCDEKFGVEAVQAWRLIKEHIYVELGEHHEDGRIKQNAPEKTVIQPKDWLWITCVLVFLILLTMLFYWVKRWHRLKDLLKEDENGAGIPMEPSKFINDKKSNQILLIYARGCSHFEKELEDVKERLRRFCTGYKIRDVYAPSEFKYVGDVKKWVHEILDAGSKVIWFDTPELRSRLNRQDHTWNDYRDEAVPYAFELARDLYQDAHSQYCYHFVVQMEEFKVEKDQDDPLQSFTPHTRWLLPVRFFDLCEKLNALIEPSKKHENFCTEITLDSSSYDRTARMI